MSLCYSLQSVHTEFEQMCRSISLLSPGSQRICSHAQEGASYFEAKALQYHRRLPANLRHAGCGVCVFTILMSLSTAMVQLTHCSLASFSLPSIFTPDTL
uniref:Uncharacterized protein n=1 Tax=Arundo donax TaxID=35708 RepID=A0A0A8ZT78_ARUDO